MFSYIGVHVYVVNLYKSYINILYQHRAIQHICMYTHITCMHYNIHDMCSMHHVSSIHMLLTYSIQYMYILTYIHNTYVCVNNIYMLLTYKICYTTYSTCMCK